MILCTLELQANFDDRWSLPEFFYLLLGQINSHLKQRTVQRIANWRNKSLSIVKALFSRREGGQGWDTKEENPCSKPPRVGLWFSYLIVSMLAARRAPGSILGRNSGGDSSLGKRDGRG